MMKRGRNKTKTCCFCRWLKFVMGFLFINSTERHHMQTSERCVVLRCKVAFVCSNMYYIYVYARDIIDCLKQASACNGFSRWSRVKGNSRAARFWRLSFNHFLHLRHSENFFFILHELRLLLYFISIIYN